MRRKDFQATVAHDNSRRGHYSNLWGALFSPANNRWSAVIPKSAGDWHREHLGLFSTPEEASMEALRAMRARTAEIQRRYLRRRREKPIPHLDGTGHLCDCWRGAIFESL
jgi:hypothetical protein